MSRANSWKSCEGGSKASSNTGQFLGSVGFLKTCAVELLSILVFDQGPRDLLRFVDQVSDGVVTGIVVEVGSRLKIEASRDRARVSSMLLCAKKAAHAYLKGLEAADTTVLMGCGSSRWRNYVRTKHLCASACRRMGPNLAARQGGATSSVRTSSTHAAHARLSVSDGAFDLAVAQLRSKRGIGTDHRTPLELKASLTWRARIWLSHGGKSMLDSPFLCSVFTRPICLLPAREGGERPMVPQCLLHVLWNSDHAGSICAWDAARARFEDSAVR